MTNTCAGCHWWYTAGTQRGKFAKYSGNVVAIKIGECRRYPPNSVPGILKESYCKHSGAYFKAVEAITVWPRTHHTDWCGEFKSKDLTVAVAKPPALDILADIDSCIKDS